MVPAGHAGSLHTSSAVSHESPGSQVPFGVHGQPLVPAAQPVSLASLPESASAVVTADGSIVEEPDDVDDDDEDVESALAELALALEVASVVLPVLADAVSSPDPRSPQPPSKSAPARTSRIMRMPDHTAGRRGAVDRPAPACTRRRQEGECEATGGHGGDAGRCRLHSAFLHATGADRDRERLTAERRTAAQQNRRVNSRMLGRALAGSRLVRGGRTSVHGQLAGPPARGAGHLAASFGRKSSGSRGVRRGPPLALDHGMGGRHAAGTMSEPLFESITTMDQASFTVWISSRPAHDDNHYELLNGRVVMMPPAGWPHGNVEGRLLRRMGNIAEPSATGLVFGSSQGFELPTGDTVEPDASFVSMTRWRAAPPQLPGKFLRLVPDLVVEILSQSTAVRDRGEKKAIYAAAGVREYCLVDTRARTLTVFLRERTRFDAGRVLGEHAPWESHALPGLTLCLADLLFE
jgi:Uma2 family endonuclease